MMGAKLDKNHERFNNFFFSCRVDFKPTKSFCRSSFAISLESLSNVVPAEL